MAYINLYEKNLLDVISLGRTATNFVTSLGDYIEVQITRDNVIEHRLYSNKLFMLLSLEIIN